MPVFQFQDKQIHYQLHLGAAPEDVIFVHGNLASTRWWQPVLANLQQRKNGQNWTGSVLVADWLGCGGSSGPKDNSELAMPSLANDLIGLVRGVGLSDVHIVGHSTGGLIGLYMLLQAPELFSSSVMLDSVAADGLQFGPEMYDAFTQMRMDKQFCSTIMASTIHNVNTSDEFIQKLFDDTFSVHERIWHGIPDALKKVDLRPKLKDIRQDILVLHGEYDTLLPKEKSKEMARLLPSAEFVEIKGQGHCCNVENPKLFWDLVWEHLFQSSPTVSRS